MPSVEEKYRQCYRTLFKLVLIKRREDSEGESAVDETQKWVAWQQAEKAIEECAPSE